MRVPGRDLISLKLMGWPITFTYRSGMFLRTRMSHMVEIQYVYRKNIAPYAHHAESILVCPWCVLPKEEQNS
jgi:hypothetical protein